MQQWRSPASNIFDQGHSQRAAHPQAAAKTSNMPKRQNATAGGGFHKLMVNRKIESAQRHSFASGMRKRVQSGFVKCTSFDGNMEMGLDNVRGEKSKVAVDHSMALAESISTTKYSSALQKHSLLNKRLQHRVMRRAP